MIELFADTDLDKLRNAGRIAAATLDWVCSQVHAGMTTADIDALVRADTKRRSGRPSQLGYHGFPAAVCTSRNDVVCHGIPSHKDVLQDGDIINIDITTEVDGFHGDTSRTITIGDVSSDALRLLDVTQRCRDAGIAVIRDGARLGDIGAAIEAQARSAGCSVVREFCGHGIGRQMHTKPSVPHFGKRGRGLRLREGMAITVEPMINLGGPEVVLHSDGWTVTTADGSLSAQFEHSVLVTRDGHEILTPPPNV